MIAETGQSGEVVARRQRLCSALNGIGVRLGMELKKGRCSVSPFRGSSAQRQRCNATLTDESQLQLPCQNLCRRRKFYVRPPL